MVDGEATEIEPGTMLDARTVWIEDLQRAWYRLSRSPLSLVGLGIVFAIIFMAIFAPWLAPHPEHAGIGVYFDQAFTRPNRQFPFGTDEVGRDILSRVIFGSRISLMLGFVVLSIALAIGVPLGLIAGYYGGKLNTIIMRTADIFLAVPALVLALAVTSAMTPSLTSAMFAISFAWWPWFTRLVQGETLSVKEEQFVEASRALGTSPLRIAFREVLPNCISPIIVKATLDMGFVILIGASLSFLGVGAQPPTPAWGTMIAEGRIRLTTAPWMCTFPGIAILITVMGFNLLGDGLRDVLDVELSGV